MKMPRQSSSRPCFPGNLLLGVFGLFPVFSGWAQGAPEGREPVSLGAGSYATARPEPCEPLPERIYKTGDGLFSLAADSPCLPQNNDWGVQMGAFGQGCGPVAIEPESWGRIKARYRGGGHE